MKNRLPLNYNSIGISTLDEPLTFGSTDHILLLILSLILGFLIGYKTADFRLFPIEEKSIQKQSFLQGMPSKQESKLKDRSFCSLKKQGYREELLKAQLSSESMQNEIQGAFLGICSALPSPDYRTFKNQ